MISIDTNVLLRYLLQDDEIQSKKADKIVNGKRNILLTDVALIETIWTLKGKRYRLSKDDLMYIVDQLFKEPNISFENGQSVWRALNVIRNTEPVKVGSKKKDADFADALILEKSKYDCGRKSEEFECMYSFDVAAQQIEKIEKP